MTSNMTMRSLGTLLVVALLTASCGGGDASTSPSTTSNASAPADGDPVEYCRALEAMFAAQPAAGRVSERFEQETSAYAVAVELAAASAPADQAESRAALAALLRDIAANPTADGIAERAFSMVGPMLAIQEHATNECGIVVEGSTDLSTPPMRSDVEIDARAIAAADAAVPAGIELTFEAVATSDAEYPALVVAPIGWQMDDVFGASFEPPDDSELGFFTELQISDGCDGICAPQDWSIVMDDPTTGPFRVLAGTGSILLDKELADPMGRLVVYADPEDSFHPVVVIATRWSDQADKYFKCEAQLDEGDEALWEAFAVACEAAVPLWIPVG